MALPALDEQGVRELAIEVLRLTVTDLGGTHAARRRSAQNFASIGGKISSRGACGPASSLTPCVSD
jgi:hypothetical protein